MAQSNKQVHINEFITRNEFSAFEKTVDANFAESKQSQAEIRHVLNNLTSKIDSMANKGVDVKTLFGGVMVIIAIIGAISSLISWGLNDKMNAQEQISKESRLAVKEAVTERMQAVENLVDKLEKLNSINHEKLVALVEKELKETATSLSDKTDYKLETINAYIIALNDRLSTSEKTLLDILSGRWSKADNGSEATTELARVKEEILLLKKELSEFQFHERYNSQNKFFFFHSLVKKELFSFFLYTKNMP